MSEQTVEDEHLWGIWMPYSKGTFWWFGFAWETTFVPMRFGEAEARLRASACPGAEAKIVPPEEYKTVWSEQKWKELYGANKSD